MIETATLEIISIEAEPTVLEILLIVSLQVLLSLILFKKSWPHHVIDSTKVDCSKLTLVILIKPALIFLENIISLHNIFR